MNDRTLTHNPQIDQLITTLTPKSAPVPLVSTWHQLHENALATMRIANAECYLNDPPDNSMINLAAAMAVLLLTVLALKRYGIIK